MKKKEKERAKKKEDGSTKIWKKRKEGGESKIYERKYERYELNEEERKKRKNEGRWIWENIKDMN